MTPSAKPATPTTPKPITPCLWFGGNAMEAVQFYTSIFKNSSIGAVTHYGKEGFEVHGMAEGTVLTVSFNLNGQPFTALNGAPAFQYTEAVSFQVFCDTQEEIDHYWNRLTDGGSEGQCGWLKDRFGVSWQVVPTILPQLLTDPARAGKVTNVFLQMKKFDIAKLLQA